jgi:hypothetical protein
MNLEHYDLEAKAGFLQFEFSSVGPKGTITKVIQFRKLVTPESQDEIYNLAFGDYDQTEKRIDDLVVSNNKDSEKILATVATAVVVFTDKHPNVLVFARGSTPARTRYYIMGITKYLKEITSSFEIWGALGEREWELFRKNRPYKALLAKRK